MKDDFDRYEIGFATEIGSNVFVLTVSKFESVAIGNKRSIFQSEVEYFLMNA
jgi:hypothetical protein